MLAFDDVRSFDAASTAADDGARRRPSVMIVCSPRPRVGKTLVARLLVEFFLADGRSVAAFDTNPGDTVLSEYLPLHTEPATIADTGGQMALFDRLIINDGMPKVVDLASGQFDTLVEVLRATNFANEARARAIDTAILFVTESHPRSVQAYRDLLQAFPEITIVPVHNEVVESYGAPEEPHPPAGVMPVHVPHVPSYLHGVIKKHGFSFAEHLRRPTSHQTLLHRWISQPFIAFRDLELRLALTEFAQFFRHRA